MPELLHRTSIVGAFALCVCCRCNCILGETDWKVLAINVKDPLAQHINGETLSVYLICCFLSVFAVMTASFLHQL